MVTPTPVANAITVALDTITLLQTRAREVAEAYRRHRIVEANHGLSELVQSTQQLLRLALAASRAAAADLSTLCVVDGVRIDAETRSAVDRLIAHQFSCDWAGVADTLDRQIAPALAQWRYVFEALADSPDDDGGCAA